MAKRTFHLSAKQGAELLLAYEQTSNVHEQKNLQVVRLYGDDWDMSAITTASGYSRASVLRAVKRYQEGGVSGLAWRVKGGNRARLSVGQRARIRQTLHEYRPDQLLAPDERQHSLPFWTVSDLRVWVGQQYGVVWASSTSYRLLLHECGLCRQRVRHQYRSRPSLETLLEAEATLEKKSLTR